MPVFPQHKGTGPQVVGLKMQRQVMSWGGVEQCEVLFRTRLPTSSVVKPKAYAGTLYLTVKEK